MVAATTHEDVFFIPVAPYDPYVLLPRVAVAQAARPRALRFGRLMLCIGAASLAFSITLATLLALHL